MQSLAHWNFAESFSGQEVALLLIGCDPTSATQMEREKAQFAYLKIRKSYLYAVSFQAGNPFLQDENLYLKSKLLRWYEEHPPENKDALLGMESLAFESQVFLRLDVASWIKTNALSTQYEFELSTETPKEYRERVARIVKEHQGNLAAAGRVLGISGQRVGQLIKGSKTVTTNAKPLSIAAHDPFSDLSPSRKGKPIK